MKHEQLSSIAKFAEELLVETNTNNLHDKNRVILSLIYAEQILDLGRTFIRADDTSQIERAEINKRMNNIRAEISNLITEMEPTSIRKLLWNTGENLKTLFIGNT